jgi:polysaccharide biosynthesis/export protein
MNFIKDIKNTSLVVAGCLIFTAGSFAQNIATTPNPPTVTTKETPTVTEEKKEVVPAPTVEEIKKTENTSNQTQPSEQIKAVVEQPADDETAQVANYYVNYMKEYKLGPEDVISVDVFAQPNYSKAGINVPPTAVIAYPLIPGGVFVGGKSTTQIEKEIAKKLSEYIIDPQVTVTLEKVGSARYAVMGDVTQPGIRLMTRKVTAFSAVMEAGGVLSTGSMRKAIIYRNGGMGYSQIPVDLDAVRKGKATDVDLQPGDQVFIPGNKMKTFNSVLDTVSKASSFRLLFGFPF